METRSADKLLSAVLGHDELRSHVLLPSLSEQSTDEGDNAGVALRGLFIISPTGVLRQITVNDLPVGRSVDETLRLVKAFQFTDEHGEVCPAGWEPGSKTIKPDVAGSKEYFEGVAATAGADDGNKKIRQSDCSE